MTQDNAEEPPDLATIKSLEFIQNGRSDKWRPVRFGILSYRGAEYLKNLDSQVILRRTGPNAYDCVSCERPADYVRVTQNVIPKSIDPFSHSTPFRIENVPYCPRCEEPPKRDHDPVHERDLTSGH